MQSIFGYGVPPPGIHLHLRSYSVKYDVPLGRETLSKSTTTGSEATEAEKKEFDDWLLQRWREKDDMLERFLQEERLSGGEYVDVPIQLRNTKEVIKLLASCILGAWVSKMLLKGLWRLLVR